MTRRAIHSTRHGYPWLSDYSSGWWSSISTETFFQVERSICCRCGIPRKEYRGSSCSCFFRSVYRKAKKYTCTCKVWKRFVKRGKFGIYKSVFVLNQYFRVLSFEADSLPRCHVLLVGLQPTTCLPSLPINSTNLLFHNSRYLSFYKIDSFLKHLYLHLSYPQVQLKAQ